MPANNSPARRAQRRQEATQRAQDTAQRTRTPPPPPNPCPNPSKASYRTWTAAQSAAKHTRRRGRLENEHLGANLPYRCRCGAWHIGHNPRRTTKPKREVD